MNETCLNSDLLTSWIMVENGNCRLQSSSPCSKMPGNMGSIFVDNDNPSSTEKQRPHVQDLI
jgi:hypothetical protein